MNHPTRLALLLALNIAAASVVICPASSAASSASAPRRYLASTEGKQRVPKPAPPKPDPDKPASSSDSNDEGNGDFFSSCLSDCLGSCVEGLFESLWSSVSSGHKESPALVDSTAATRAFGSGQSLAPEAAAAPLEYEPHTWALHDVGYLRAYVPGDSVVLRRGPADADSLKLEAGRLPDGARVLVSSTRVGQGGTMLEVRGVDEPAVGGWVHEKQLRLAGDATPIGEPPAVPASPARRVERWAITLAAGPAAIDNPELDADYSDGATALEAEYLRTTRRAWTLGVGAGYRGFTGKPKAEYRGATEIDFPQRSRFRLTYVTTEFGQRHAWAQGLRLGYMAGPVVGYVFEDADIMILDEGTRVPIGGRHERLGRLAGGGGATTWFAVALPIPLEVGLRFRAFALAWSGHHQKSLTSDYTDAGLLHLDAALTLTHAGH